MEDAEVLYRYYERCVVAAILLLLAVFVWGNRMSRATAEAFDARQAEAEAYERLFTE